MDQKKRQHVAIYARVSTEEQAEHGYSIEAQIDEIRRFCERNGKEVLWPPYVDRGVSGKEMTKRLELQRLLADAEKGLFNEVVTWKLNRLSRKQKDLLEIVERLSRHNVSYRSCTENFETETSTGRLLFQLLGSIGEFERNTIVENVSMGLKQRARQGYHNGGQCLGYEPTLDGSDKRVIQIVPHEAELVRKIFDWYASGRGCRSIVNELNREGYRTKRNNTFSTCAIREIVTNPLYVGKIRYGRYERWSEKRRKGKSDEPIIVDGRHEAIITEDVWERSQEIFKQRSKANPKVHAGVALLTSILRCPECGSPMVASNSQYKLKDGSKATRRYYSCGKFRDQGSSVCHANSVRVDYAEKYVLDRIREVVLNPKMIQDVLAAASRKQQLAQQAIREEIPGLEDALDKIAKRRERLMEAFEDAIIERSTLTRRMADLEAEEQRLLERKAEVDQLLEAVAGDVLAADKVRVLLGKIDKLLARAKEDQRKVLLQFFIREIVVKERKIERIEFQFDPQTVEHFFEQDPSAISAEGSLFSFWRSKRKGLLSFAI